MLTDVKKVDKAILSTFSKQARRKEKSEMRKERPSGLVTLKPHKRSDLIPLQPKIGRRDGRTQTLKCTLAFIPQGNLKTLKPYNLITLTYNLKTSKPNNLNRTLACTLFLFRKIVVLRSLKTLCTLNKVLNNHPWFQKI